MDRTLNKIEPPSPAPIPAMLLKDIVYFKEGKRNTLPKYTTIKVDTVHHIGIFNTDHFDILLNEFCLIH